MTRIIRLNWLHLVLFFVMIPFNSLNAAQRSEEPGSEEAVMIGRISHLEGGVLRYVPEKDDWVATVKDAPFGMDDTLRSDEHGRAEFIIPNNTWMRINGDTRIQIITLEEDITGIYVASGIARFYNKGSNAIIKATTPFGYVTAPAGTCFDLYVGDESVEVISIKGKVEFIRSPYEKKFAVIAGSSSIVADSRQTTAGEGYGTPDWEDWNRIRDNIWQKRAERKGNSVKYLPPALNHDAWVLDEYGTWARVYYEGAYRYFWRPVHVGIGWAPFTVGRWTLRYGDQCWIPAERFGYVTHHYGNWVLVKGAWYWAPPVVRARIRFGPPFFNIGFAWYPGRVAWIHSGVHIGWVPLAPFEPYYSHRRWGRRSVVVKNVNTININIRNNRYRYFNRAVIIHREKLHRVNSYKGVRIRTKNNAAVITKYRTAPVVGSKRINKHTKNDQPRRRQRVIKNKNIERPRERAIKRLPASGGIRKKYNYREVNPAHKSGRTVNKKVNRKKLEPRMNSGVRAKTVPKIAKNGRHDNLVKETRIIKLKVKSRPVPADQVSRPVSKLKFKGKKLRKTEILRARHKVRAAGKTRSVNPAHKSRRIVTKKVHRKKLEPKMSSGVSAKTVPKIAKNGRHSNLVKKTRIIKLKNKSRPVPAVKVNRPVSEIKFKKRELRKAEIRQTRHKVRAVRQKKIERERRFNPAK